MLNLHHVAALVGRFVGVVIGLTVGAICKAARRSPAAHRLGHPRPVVRGLYLPLYRRR